MVTTTNHEVASRNRSCHVISNRSRGYLGEDEVLAKAIDSDRERNSVVVMATYS